MAFFHCSRCGCQEDTVLCNYWSARIRETPLLCSACDPKIRKWHGQFLREGQGALSQGGSSTEAIKMRSRMLEAALELADARKMISAPVEPAESFDEGQSWRDRAKRIRAKAKDNPAKAIADIIADTYEHVAQQIELRSSDSGLEPEVSEPTRGCNRVPALPGYIQSNTASLNELPPPSNLEQELAKALEDEP